MPQRRGQGRCWGAISGPNKETWWACQGGNDRVGRPGPLRLAPFRPRHPPQPAVTPQSDLSRDDGEAEAEVGSGGQRPRQAGLGRGEADTEPGMSPSSEVAAENTRLSGFRGEGAVGFLLQDRPCSCGPREACHRGYLRAVGSLCHGDLLPVCGSASASNSHKARQRAGGLRGGSQRATWGLSRPLGRLPLK